MGSFLGGAGQNGAKALVSGDQVQYPVEGFPVPPFQRDASGVLKGNNALLV